LPLPTPDLLPKVDPSATNVLDNQPDVNLPDATGSVSGSFDFITAFYNKFVDILVPPMVSDSDKQDLENIINDPDSSEDEKSAAQAQLDAANMVNMFSSPLVRLVILTYIIIIILNILRRIPGVSGVPSMSSIANNLFNTGSYTWTDRIQIVDGFMTISDVLRYDTTYVKDNTSAIYVNYTGAEIAEQGSNTFPQNYVYYNNGKQYRIPLFPETLIEKSWMHNFIVKIDARADYYLKFTNGSINIGTESQPNYYELTSVKKATDCEPLLLGQNRSVVQKAKGRQVRCTSFQKIRNTSATTKISVTGIPQNEGNDYTDPIGNLTFVKNARMVDGNLEPTDTLKVTNITFDEGQLHYGWDIENLPKGGFSNYLVTFVMSSWNHRSGGLPEYVPNWPSGNTIKFLDQDGNDKTGYRVIRVSMGGFKRMDEKKLPLYEEEIPYSPKYIEIWIVNDDPDQSGYNDDPELNIITIEDKDNVGSLFLNSNDKPFEESGLNNLESIFTTTAANSIRYDLSSASNSFASAVSQSDPNSFWNNFSSAMLSVESASRRINGYKIYSSQIEYLYDTVNAFYGEISSYYSSNRHDVIPSDVSKVTEFSQFANYFQSESNRTGQILGNRYENIDEGDASHISLEDSSYYNDRTEATVITQHRWKPMSSSVQEKQQRWDEMYKIIRNSIRDIYPRSGVEFMRGTSWASYEEEISAPAKLAFKLTTEGHENVHFIGSHNGMFGYLYPMTANWDGSAYVHPNYGPDYKRPHIAFVNGSATVESDIGIDAIGEKYPPQAIVQDVPEMTFEAQDPCTQPQSSMEKKMAMLLENDADQFTVMAAFGCCYTDDLWDKFQELKKLRRHMVRN